MQEVHLNCHAAFDRTQGRFDAWWSGWFDPTGYVKGWAAEHAHRDRLMPMLALPGVAAVGLGVGGDIQVATAPDAVWSWRIGVADPRLPDAILATIPLRDGAVATSGSAERGHHIVDPRTGEPATSVASATVVTASLTKADVWATASVVAGFDDLSWTPLLPNASGLLVAADGRVRRWAAGVEVSVSAA